MSKLSLPLDLIIVGAGLAGLSTAIACAQVGHHVTILEAAKQLSEIGAGLQICPNSSRILYSWGLKEAIEKVTCEPATFTVHRYSDGAVLAKESGFDRQMREKYGSPLLDIHRGDFHTVLCNKASELGVNIHINSRVVSVNPEERSVETESGQSFSGDLIIGADGLWSMCRETMLGQKDPPKATGDLAYRIVLTIDQIKDQELQKWVKTPECHFWAGPNSHAVGYSMRDGRMYNLVLLCPDDLPESVARQEGSIKEMKELFKDWDPVLTRFLDCVESVDRWKLMHRSELDRWVTEDGAFTLIGDSCHPMLPYLAQGANSSIEDGAALGAVLEGIQTKSELASRMKVWEQVRKARGEAIQRETFLQRHDFHLPDGPEQIARDDLFLSQLGKPISQKFPSRWTCPVVQPWLFGYDAVEMLKTAMTFMLREEQNESST